jgi:hypothetical protein
MAEHVERSLDQARPRFRPAILQRTPDMPDLRWDAAPDLGP